MHVAPGAPAALVLAVERAPAADLTAKDMLRHLATDYAAALLPKKIWFTDSIPRGDTGKKSRAAVSREYARTLLDELAERRRAPGEPSVERAEKP